MDSNGRYLFKNFTSEPFEGRFGGQPYLFAPSETKEYDPDKHYMLIVLSKQLADRELAKGVKGVLRTKEAGNDYGKAIDANGNLYKPSIEMRKELMRKSIGKLADIPIPFPTDSVEEPEAGETKQATENIEALQDQVKNLTEMMQGLTKALGEKQPAPSTPVNPLAGNGHAEEVTATATPSVGFTRDVLESMLRDKGVAIPDNASKDQLIGLLGSASSIGATA